MCIVNWVLILEYIKAFLTLPVAAIVVALVFRKDVSKLLSRVAILRFPGGQIEASQLEKIAEEKTAASQISAEPRVDDAQASLPIANGNHELQALLEAEKSNSGLWEFRYLNFFLARRTQRVLDWLSTTNAPITINLFHNSWLTIIPQRDEREAVFAALLNHNLIEMDGEVVKVTQKGRDYIFWRGPLPATGP